MRRVIKIKKIKMSVKPKTDKTIKQKCKDCQNKFQIPVICNLCINFIPKYKLQHQEFEIQIKHSFEVDNVVEIILSYLSIEELISARLINTCCNLNAVQILQKPASQSKLKPMRLVSNLKDFETTVQKSPNPKLFRNLDFYGNRPENLNKIIEILANLQLEPLEVIFQFQDKNGTLSYYFEFITYILLEISETVRRIELQGLVLKEDNVIEVEDLHFPQLKEFIMNTTLLESEQESIQNFLQFCTKNSPKLTKIQIPFLPKSCQIFSPNVQLVNLHLRTDAVNPQCITQLLKLDKIRLESFKFSLIINKGGESSMEEHLKNFANFHTFLQKQSSTLKVLSLVIYFKDLFPIGSSTELRVNLPILPKLEVFQFSINDDVQQYNSDWNAWPMKPINFVENFPNLKKIGIYTIDRYWSKCFLNPAVESTPCEWVKEIEYEFCDRASVRRVFKNFPKIEICKILNGGEFYEQDLKYFSCWSSTLQKIEITLTHAELQRFDFKHFLHLPNLLEIILKTDSNDNFWDQRRKLPIEPNFAPLSRLEKLSTLSLKGYKIYKNIIKELQKNYLNFNYEI